MIFEQNDHTVLETVKRASPENRDEGDQMDIKIETNAWLR